MWQCSECGAEWKERVEVGAVALWANVCDNYPSSFAPCAMLNHVLPFSL